MMKKLIITLIYTLPLLGLAQATSFEFTKHLIDEDIDGAAYSQAADLDLDGDIDIVVAAYDGDEFVWFENDGNENFTKHLIVSSFENAYEHEIIDLDLDGDLDIWARNDTEVTWFENDGNQNFTKKSFMAMFGYSKANPMDFNGDGDSNFVIFESDSIIWYENTGGQTYTSHVVINVENFDYIVAGDLDGDLDTDFISRDTTGQFYFSRNINSLNIVNDSINFDYSGDTWISQLINIDGDGDLDLLGVDALNNKLYWYEYDGDKNYTRHVIDSLIDYPLYAAAGDINKDGHMDIAASGHSDNKLLIYLNDGDENFTKYIIDSNLSQASGSILIDLDGDYDLDIISNSFAIDQVLWYENIFDVEPRVVSNPSDQNYVYTILAQTEATDIVGLNKEGDVIESIAYFDGLGRPMQSIAIQAGGSREDIITHVAYDDFGRQTHNYLPYASSVNFGSYQVSPLSTIQSYYKTTYPDDFTGLSQANTNAWSEKHLEASPLSRILEQGAPGEDWLVDKLNDTDHTIKFDYQSNDSLEVKLFTVSLAADYTPSLIQNIHYTKNTVYKTITKDENWQPGQTNDKDHTTEEFKDKQGRVLLKRTYNNDAAHETYYVYDDFGNLTYVLPPKMDVEINTIAIINTLLDDLAYQYKYDSRNRLVEKKIPGKGWESIVYDKLDRPVLTQDAIQKLSNQWLFTKYDVFGRVVYTGILSNESRVRDSIQKNEFNTKTAPQNYESRVTSGTGYDNTHYSNLNFPINNTEVLTVNYYDDYDYAIAPFDPNTNPEAVFGKETTYKTKGLATGSKVKVLETSLWITTVSYYDEKARAIYVYSHNEFLNTTDLIKTDLDFVGKVLKTRSSHQINSEPEIITLDTYFYDHMGRLLKQIQCVGTTDLSNNCGDKGATGVESELLVMQTMDPNTSTNIEASNSITLGPGFQAAPQPGQTIGIVITSQSSIIGSAIELIAENIYDQLGQLEMKKVGNTELNPLQTIDYSYNIRGWLKNINQDANDDNDLFNFTLMYNDIVDSSKKLFNGNISQTSWNTLNVDSSVKTYTYTYDALNRITSATGANTSNYNLSGITYDKMGNILSLTRNGWQDNGDSNYTNMDVLTYDYGTENANKLYTVTDSGNDNHGFKDGNKSGNDYTYDDNGNMITDKNKGITSITYNHLSLPTQVTIVNGTDNGNIQYVYDATGVKQRKIVSTGTTTDYVGNYIYENNTLQFFNHTEGYVEPNGTSFDYVYQYKDHLGNIRLSYSDADGNGSIATSEIREEHNYYPFGLKHQGYNSNINGTHHKYMFGGKELQDDAIGSSSFAMYDFGARNYDPALGRWMNLDPLAELMRKHSPYNYAFDNPIYFIDPDGMAPRSSLIDWSNHDAYYNGQSEDSDDNGYDEDGNQINDNGGDETDYVYNEDGEVVSSTSVESAGPIPSSSPTRGYGFKGFRMANGGLNEDNTIANLFIGGAILKPVFTKLVAIIGTITAKSSTAIARSLGIAGERAVGIGSKVRIPSLSGTAKYRIPDGLTSTTLTEVKNVAHQSLIRQLRDFHMFSQQTGRQFILYTRPKTTFSGPLQNLIDQGQIIVKPIPGL